MWSNNQFLQDQDNRSNQRYYLIDYSLQSNNFETSEETFNDFIPIPTQALDFNHPENDFYSSSSLPPLLSPLPVTPARFYPNHPESSLISSTSWSNPFNQISSPQFDWSYLPNIGEPAEPSTIDDNPYSRYDETLLSLPPSPSSSSSISTPSPQINSKSNKKKSIRVMPYRNDSTGFATKLYWLLENEDEFRECIRWDKTGKHFLVDVASNQFLENVLPDLFSHKNATSFCRQLQIYEFKRLSTSEVDFNLPQSSNSSNPLRPHQSDWRVYSHKYMSFGNEKNLKLLRPRQSKARLTKRKGKSKQVKDEEDSS